MDTNGTIIIHEAYRALKGKRYSEAAAILEKAAASSYSIKEPYPHFLMAVCYLFMDRFDLAEREMNRIRSVDQSYLPYLELQAFVTLKSTTDPDPAITAYVDLSARFPKNPNVKRALRDLRSNPQFQVFQKRARLQDYVNIPKPPKPKRGIRYRPHRKAYSGSAIFVALKKFFWVLVFLSITGGAAYSIIHFNLIDMALRIFAQKDSVAVYDNESIDMVNIGGSEYDLIKRINEKSVPVFYYTPEEMTSDFNSAKYLIKRGKYNEAVLLLNRISNSNASINVRDKVEFLHRFISSVDDREFEPVEFRKVYEKPYLYRGYALMWEGKAANIRAKNGRLEFNLLTEYRDKDLFSGVADVYSDKTVPIFNGDMVAVSGIFINSIGESKKPYVHARDIVKKYLK